MSLLLLFPSTGLPQTWVGHEAELAVEAASGEFASRRPALTIGGSPNM